MNATATDSQTLRVATLELVSINPATLEDLGRLPISTDDEIQIALTRARAAQPAWAALSFKERAKYILRAKDVLLERQDELCELLAREAGKPAVEALSSEVLPVANLMD